MKNTLNLFAFLGTFLIAAIPSATAIAVPNDFASAVASPTSACVPATHVVIDSSTVEIYNATIHGTHGHLRLFKMIPLACPNRHVRTLPRESSSRTDLQLRDTRTELSDIVFRRGFLSWASSQLKWVPWLSTAAGLFGLGVCTWEWAAKGASALDGTTCVLGAVTTILGVGGIYQTAVADSLLSATATANFQMVDFTRTWADVGTQTIVSPLSASYRTLLQNSTIPGARHHASGKAVTMWDVARANLTHPITVLHNHPAFKANHSHAVDVWSSVHDPDSGMPRLHLTVPFPYASNITSSPTSTSSALRRRQTGCFNIGEDEECVTPGSTVPPGAPTQMYYGFDLYGTKAEIDEYDDDLGTKYDNENGFEPAIVEMTNDIMARQAWDTCVCEQTQGKWISTGSLQMSWDGYINDNTSISALGMFGLDESRQVSDYEPGGNAQIRGLIGLRHQGNPKFYGSGPGTKIDAANDESRIVGSGSRTTLEQGKGNDCEMSNEAPKGGTTRGMRERETE
ncbi:hypothetical protein C8R45DRAFT_1185215 [Mycena sanguinolenta]|nr:hypothetical protein C8R45DRAFT_1185215 [Mycena sanguinolenta]